MPDMKEVKISLNDGTAIKAVLREVNGQAWNYALTTTEEVEALAKRAERIFDSAAIPQRMRVGSTLNFVGSGGPSKTRYSAKRPVTAASFRRTAKGWVMTGVAKDYRWPGNPETFTLSVSDEIKGRIVQQALKHIHVAA